MLLLVKVGAAVLLVAGSVVVFYALVGMGKPSKRRRRAYR
jgi:hypothetical protein